MAVNRYAYANNNPISYTDPDGHNPKLILDFALNVSINMLVTGQPGFANAAVETAKGAINRLATVSKVKKLVVAIRAANQQMAKAGKGIKAGEQAVKGSGRNLPFNDSGRITEVNNTLDKIESKGPFAFKKDGTTFKNKEGRLPEGSYREYTVNTPGASDRGARRVVQDSDAGKTFYTDDHYRSFIQIDPVKR